MINLFTKRTRLPVNHNRSYWQASAIGIAVSRSVIWALFCLSFLVPGLALSQDLPAITREAEKLEASFKEYEALQKYKEVLRHQPVNLNALCRASDLCSRIGHRENDKAKKADYFK